MERVKNILQVLFVSPLPVKVIYPEQYAGPVFMGNTSCNGKRKHIAQMQITTWGRCNAGFMVTGNIAYHA